MPKIIDRPLTALEVKNITKAGYTALGGATGLYLFVKKSGRRYYVYRYQTWDGKRSMVSLGPTNEIDLSEARKMAVDWKQRLRNGDIPADVKREKRAQIQEELRQKAFEIQKARNTFFFVSENWIRERSAGGYWKNNSLGETKTQGYLDLYINDPLGDIPISELEAFDVLEMLKPIYQTKPNTSEKCLTIVSAVWKWARARGLCDGENPADRKGTLGVLLEPYKNNRKEKINYPALDFKDIPDFFIALRSKETISARMTEFTILTALRSKMARFAKWEDVNFDEQTLTINEVALKTKGRGSHTVYLSKEALELLKSLPRINELIFPAPRTGRAMSDAAMGSVIRDLHEEAIRNHLKGWIDPIQTKEKGVPAIVTIHGTARATFKTWCRTGENRKRLDDDAVEFCLAHNLKDDYGGAYNRATLETERRQVMAAWGSYCYSKIR